MYEPDHPHQRQLNAAEEGDDDEDRRPAGNGERAGELRDEREDADDERERRERGSPPFSARRSGAFEKLTRPSAARRSDLRNEYFGSPAKRSGRLYGTPIWRNPTQLNMPRT